MRVPLLAVVIGGLALAACGAAKPPAAVPEPGDAPAKVGPADPVPTGVGPRSETVTADTPRATERGVTYVTPAGWSRIASGSIAIMTSPDPATKVAIVDATAAEPDAAVTEAWALYRSTPAPPLRAAEDAAARDGWDQVREYRYEPAGTARALRRAGAWTVVIIDAPAAPTGGAAAQLVQSVRPAAP